MDASRAWPQTYHEARSRRIAERGLAVGVIHQRAPLRELVDVRRLHFGMKIHAADPVILVVDRYEQDVGLIGGSQVRHGQDENDEGYDIFHDRD